MIFHFFQKIYEWVKSLFSNSFKIVVAENTIKNSQINISNGDLIQSTNIIDSKNKESAEAYEKQLIALFENKFLVDTNNDKFQFYLNHSLLIIKLNDTETKRNVLKTLLIRKFTGEDTLFDDSDSPTTIALDAMRYLTDSMLKRLCVHRLITNVLPSIISDKNEYLFSAISDFIRKNGLLNNTETLNLRRLGILHDMGMRAFSCNEIRSNIPIPELDNTDESFYWSSCLSPAGIELTNITLDYFLHIQGPFDLWLPITNKSLHLKGLTVDEDVRVKKNIVANGEVSAGGASQPSDYESEGYIN